MKNQVVYSVFQGKIIDFLNLPYILFKRKLSIMTQQQPTSVDNNRYRSTRSAIYLRYLWIRTALIHRSLHKIVEYIVDNSSSVLKKLFSSFFFYNKFSRKFYEPYALVCNSVQGPILASLLGKYII